MAHYYSELEAELIIEDSGPPWPQGTGVGWRMIMGDVELRYSGRAPLPHNPNTQPYYGWSAFLWGEWQWGAIWYGAGTRVPQDGTGKIVVGGVEGARTVAFYVDDVLKYTSSPLDLDVSQLVLNAYHTSWGTPLQDSCSALDTRGGARTWPWDNASELAEWSHHPQYGEFEVSAGQLRIKPYSGLQARIVFPIGVPWLDSGGRTVALCMETLSIPWYAWLDASDHLRVNRIVSGEATPGTAIVVDSTTAYDAVSAVQWDGRRLVLVARKASDGKPYLFYSVDHGTTWTGPTDVS